MDLYNIDHRAIEFVNGSLSMACSENIEKVGVWTSGKQKYVWKILFVFVHVLFHYP